MRRTYSYTEAVQILGGKDHPVVAAMDKALGGALLAGSLGLWQVLDLFDAKPDFTRLFSELVTKLSDKRRGLSRYDRTQRLAAAHAVVVMTAFFESLQALELPFRLSPADTEHVHGFAPFEQSLPLPKAGRPYEDNLRRIAELYEHLTADTSSVLLALSHWDQLTETEAGRVLTQLAPLPGRALARYEELFRQLAVDFPEIAFWCSLEDHRGTRAALARLEEVLRETTTDITADTRQTELCAVYRAALDRPLLRSGDIPNGLRVPTLGEAYVDPRFQVLGSSDRPLVPSIADSWADVPERADLDGFLAGHLTSPRACNAPLLVLGDPGSGKSVLTEMLAARLPASDFAVVRIELRDTPVDADLVRQVEHGLHHLLDDQVSWAGFSRRTGGAVPVVILDGLDELMQATGVGQTRYLTTIAEFQERLRAKGRPAIFVVTSRLSVCAGMELPPWSSVVRLLPFSDDQVRQWLDVWNASNPPLPAEVALSYPDLAAQPLLLLMLALFEAVDGSLQRDRASLSQAQLYERLLSRFAEREITKSGASRSAADVRADVEFELDRLSVVALAMFNRGAQWVTEQQVSADLAVLLEVESADRSVGTRTPLSAGELALGRFFFVQKSEAVRGDDTRLATYEFLHATFGEYLVARFAWRTLLELHREDSARSRRKSTVDDTELYSVLSYMTLTTSQPVLGFLRNLSVGSDRDGLFGLVVRLLATRDDRRLSRGTYEPVPTVDSVRDARYAVNLVVLALLLRRRIYASDIGFHVDDWQRAALFWKSRLPRAEWASVVRMLWVDRDPDRHFSVSLSGPKRSTGVVGIGTTEPYLTLDEVGLMIREALAPLISAYGFRVAAALVELSAATVHDWLPALTLLADASPPEDLLVREVSARLGRGGDDRAILAEFSGIPFNQCPEALDAMLRLHEQDSPVLSEDWRIRGSLVVLVREALEAPEQVWPDLLKRATAAAHDLGLQRPPTKPPPAPTDPPR
ncbi:hypothetical protein BBK82_36815 [Lentzea guizhouensis]|uniref:NACHT N-terminal Helical domain-containing protein n=1 Tax=Lentzea guizhouensis TaxID=1586287 RepID=A0A1B2HSP9_9PSEU|nr:ATP-binding protein [Lentzea guizhouensis]ANZ40733.1 hypothetical protein BBK82_36815 [Lentzea guizhouensis]